METITLHKLSHEEYWTQEYEKFNTLQSGERNQQNTNLYNVGSRDKPDLVVFKFKKQHINLTEEGWKKLCFSPYVHTKIKRVTVVVEKMVEDGITKKVRISKYFTVKGRKCGAKYFWKTRMVVHVTFDLINNNVYKTTTHYVGRKKSTTVLKNPFKYWKRDDFNLPEIIFDLDLSQTTVMNNLNKFVDNPKYWDKRDKISVELYKCHKSLIKELAGKDLNLLIRLGKNKTILETASIWFTKVRGIKTPDKWLHYFTKNYPGIKPLRKRDNNLIQTILKEEGIYSKYAIKLLNTNKDIKIASYQMMLEVLGIQLVQELKPELLSENYNLGWQLNLELTLEEKRNFISILNSLLDPNVECPPVDMVVGDIISDHLGRLKHRLIVEGLNPKLKARDYYEFVDEHHEWTNLVDEINNSTTITHIYGKDFLNHIQQPITIGNQTMTPVVLRDTYEYRNESNVQHNCVKSYIEYKDTCVISLRDKKDNRITNEFIPHGDGKIMTNIQSRGRFNSQVTEDLQPFVNLLNLKMKESSKEKIYKKHQVLKECKLTGIAKTVEKRGRLDYRMMDDLPF
tara:strand:+ start:233 stop:1936 length:1704 start_codon:yes stop_codon:yes gene_type:complete